MHKMKYTHILWDFNGTILNDVNAGIASNNVMLALRSLPTIESVEEYRRIFGFPIIDYYRRLGFDLDVEPYDKIAHEWLKLYLEQAKTAELFDGITDVLKEIKRRGIEQIILSATEKSMLEKQLFFLGIRGYFSEVLGLEDIYAHSKVELGRTWMKKTHPGRSLLIGDTEHDFEVAKSIGAECVLVAGGHQLKETLESCGAVVLDNIKEIVKIL